MAEAELEVRVEGPDGQQVPASIEDTGKNGAYTVSYKPIAAGTHRITVTAAGGAVGKSPYTAVIKGAVSAAHSHCDNWYLTVKARTAEGEDLDAGEDDVRVEVRGAAGSEAVPAKVKDLGTGEYFVSFTLKQRGQYAVHASVNGEALQGSPFQIIY